MKDILLPRIYTDPFGNYPQHKGKPKISYSQYTSWIHPEYVFDYIRQYFMGLWEDPGIFANFGTACGEYIEKLKVNSLLSKKDIEILNQVPRPEGAVYEREIVIDRGSYVIQGFIDQETPLDEVLIMLLDMKTGNIKTKEAFYGGPEYEQTTMYSYQRENEGKVIKYSGVKLLGRKGTGKYGSPLHLSGAIIDIPTPYSRERAENFLKKMDKVVQEISDEYKLYLKLTGQCTPVK